MAPAAVGRAVLSEPGRAYLGNQLVPRGLASGRDRLIQILLDATQPGRKVDEMAAARALEAAQANIATRGPQ
jgi:F0F1-type ATP synthase epsilon subunit